MRVTIKAETFPEFSGDFCQSGECTAPGTLAYRVTLSGSPRDVLLWACEDEGHRESMAGKARKVSQTLAQAPRTGTPVPVVPPAPVRPGDTISVGQHGPGVVTGVNRGEGTFSFSPDSGEAEVFGLSFSDISQEAAEPAAV